MHWAIGGLAAFFLFYLSWQAFEWLPGERAKVGDLFFLPVDAAAVIAAWGAAQRCAQCPRLCWFWRLFALALSAQMTGDAVMAIYDFGPGEAPFPSLVDPPYIAFYLLMGLALINVPVSGATRSQQRRIGLDLAAAILGGGMVIWYLVLAPTVTEGEGTLLQMATSVAYPVGDVVLLAALSIVALRWSPPTLHRSLTVISFGLAMFIVADIVYGYTLLHDGYTAGDPVDALWIGAMCLFAIAALLQQEALSGTPETSIPARAPYEHKVSWLPFAALVIGSVTLLVSQWDNRFIPDVSLIVIAIALAGLIAVRQYLAQNEMIRLQQRLREAHDEVARLATHDALTGLPNRRSLDQGLEAELQRAKRNRRPLSLLFIDVDHFKRVNDEHGHEAGDNALAQFATVLSDCLRPSDMAARWGGEEFVVALPETGAEEALATAERVRAAVEGHLFSFAGGAKLTCSIGMSSYGSEADTVRSLLNLADEAVYAAKRQGRNTVIAAG